MKTNAQLTEVARDRLDHLLTKDSKPKKKKKMTRAMIQKRMDTEPFLHIDKFVCKRNGTVEFKEGYFYHHGRTPEKVADKILKFFPDCTLVECYDAWAAWPKDSWLVAVVKFNGTE